MRQPWAKFHGTMGSLQVDDFQLKQRPTQGFLRKIQPMILVNSLWIGTAINLSSASLILASHRIMLHFLDPSYMSLQSTISH